MEEKELTWYDKHISYLSLTLPIRGPEHYSLSIPNLFPISMVSCQKGPTRHAYVSMLSCQKGPTRHAYVSMLSCQKGPTRHAYVSMVSCQKGPTRHAYAWQIGPFWQDTLDIQNLICL